MEMLKLSVGSKGRSSTPRLHQRLRQHLRHRRPLPLPPSLYEFNQMGPISIQLPPFFPHKFRDFHLWGGIDTVLQN